MCLFNKSAKNNKKAQRKLSALTDTEISDKIQPLNAGQRVRVKWSYADGTNMETWVGVIRTKPTATTATILYDEWSSSELDLPSKQTKLKYYVLELHTTGQQLPDIMTVMRLRVSLTGITPWQPKSWGALLQHHDKVMGRVMLMGELGRFYHMSPLRELSPASQASDYEKATLYEGILAWVVFGQTINEWNSPGYLSVAEALVLRLCALLRGEGLSGRDRTEAINEVYEAAAKPLGKDGDALSLLMLKPRKK